MQGVARGQAGGVGGERLTEEQRLCIASNRQKALDKRASKSAGPGPSLALAAPPHVVAAPDGAATAALVPGAQLVDVHFTPPGLLGMVLEEQADGVGVFVECVDAGGQAESAGVRAGWTLAAINRQAVACLCLDGVMDLLGSCGRPLQLSFRVGVHMLPRGARLGSSGMSSVESASQVAIQHWEAQDFRSTCRHVIRSVRPRPRVPASIGTHLNTVRTLCRDVSTRLVADGMESGSCELRVRR
jgi:hypothetical protein